MTSIATARTFNDLLTPSAEPSPYEYETLFAAKSWFERRRATKRFKLLKKLDPRLRAVLRPDERVFFVTSGTTVNFAEQFFVGWAAFYLNRRALVFTTDRILLVQIDSSGKPLDLISQLRFDQIASVKSTWNRVCEVRLQRGLKLKFQSVPSAERKFLHQFLKDIVKPAAPAVADPVNRIEQLCPTCFAVVTAHPPACPKCGAAFKSAKKAGLLSLAFPGLGDFYIGHKGFATLELLGGLMMWVFVVVSPLLSGGIIDEETGAVLQTDAAYWTFAAVIIGIAHGMDAMMTHHFAMKGHYPAK
jgi:hypothetical protein